MTKTTKSLSSRINRLSVRGTGVEDRRVAQRIIGHEASPDWLPAGRWPELDEFRVGHLRLLGQVDVALTAIEDHRANHHEADVAHEAALVNAARTGGTPPSDKRAPDAKRGAQLKPLIENAWAACYALAGFVEEAVEVIRDHEDRWLASLSAELGPIGEQRAEAQRLVDEARAAEFELDRIGRWLQIAADDQIGTGQQPAPASGARAPAGWPGLHPDVLKRHWSKARPWNGSYAEDRRSQQNAGVAGALPNPHPASEARDPGEPGNDLIQPLDPDPIAA